VLLPPFFEVVVNFVYVAEGLVNSSNVLADLPADPEDIIF
jgi:hypothetical protein